MDELTDKAMLRARELFAESGLTLDELGQRMGHSGDVARKAAWQLLNKVNDPKISTLRALAKAFGVPVEELVTKEKGRKPMIQKAHNPDTKTFFYRCGELIEDFDENNRLTRKTTSTISQQARSGASSGEFPVQGEDGVICKWQLE